MEHEWTLAPLGTGRLALPLVSSDPVIPHRSRTSPIFYILGVVFCLKNIYSPKQGEAAGARENLGLGILGSEFYVVLVNLLCDLGSHFPFLGLEFSICKTGLRFSFL